jgi:hypothetical protein
VVAYLLETYLEGVTIPQGRKRHSLKYPPAAEDNSGPSGHHVQQVIQVPPPRQRKIPADVARYLDIEAKVGRLEFSDEGSSNIYSEDEIMHEPLDVDSDIDPEGGYLLHVVFFA